MKEGGIGFETNKSVQRRRKVEMRKGGKAEIMKRNQALNTGGREGAACQEAASVCVCVLGWVGVGWVIRSC